MPNGLYTDFRRYLYSNDKSKNVGLAYKNNTFKKID